jgi:hypothetical protein
MSDESVIDPVTHKPRLLKEQCKTCVGRPGNLMKLRPGRLQQLIRENTGPDAHGLVCHETLSYSQNPHFGPAYCHWFFETYGDLANLIRIYKRLGNFTKIDPPGENPMPEPAITLSAREHSAQKDGTDD